VNAKPIALITGVTGQDGSYLAEFLLAKGYAVHGLARRSSLPNTQRIAHLLDRIVLHQGDVCDATGLVRLVQSVRPAEIYNLAAQTDVAVSFEEPDHTTQVNALGALRVFEAARAARDLGLCEPRLYQASTSEMYGDSTESPQSESTAFLPRSPYACAKVFAHLLVHNAREAHGLHACSGILFNHESPRRSPNAVTRKIAAAVARIEAGQQDRLTLGALTSCRDWGWAPDYIEAMWLMLQQDEPDDFVIATGATWSVQDFVERAFAHAELDWRSHVDFDEDLLRPADVARLVGDASKANKRLGWSPRVCFDELVPTMVDAERELLRP